MKTVIVSLRLRGAKIHQIAKGLGISTRSVWKTIQDNRPFYRETFFAYDHRRLPRSYRSKLIEVKISKVARALIAWVQHFDIHGSFDLEAVMAGNKPP